MHNISILRDEKVRVLILKQYKITENQDSIENSINFKKSDAEMINVFNSYSIKSIKMIEILVI